ncbi:unnamed protein product [Lymnaea stagnalis]|uniref:Uncharacterized protein n=1 Tax=Lymnaea stagnalis TaxID=6523 RepID=A0AAV2HH33_LYMST
MYKPTLTFTGYVATVIYLYILICSRVQGQSVHLDPTSVGSISTCSSGLRDGLDSYSVRGSVNATTAKFSNLVDFYIRTASFKDFIYLCTASLVTCVTPNPQPCYCAVKTGNIYEILANRSAVLSDSNAAIRIQWDSSSGGSVVSNELQVPKIYDVNYVTTRLTINDVNMTCPAIVAHGSVIKFQCENSPSPCDIFIAVNHTEVANGEHNATYTVPTDLKLYSEHNFTFSYSVCGGAITSKTCPVTIDKNVLSRV